MVSRPRGVNHHPNARAPRYFFNMPRPLTTRDARRAYLDSTRLPRISKAEERRRELEELERIREEERQARERARARAARERKRAREEAERAEKKRKGEPVVPVTASQGMISVFFKKGGLGGGCQRKGEGGNRGDAGAACEDSRREGDEGVNGMGEKRDVRGGEAQACAELDGHELDDLFLSASQLDREVGGLPQTPKKRLEVGRISQTPRKRCRDEAFRRPDPPPPKPPDRASPRTPTIPGPEESYDLGVSSQELLQVEAQEAERRCVPDEARGENQALQPKSKKTPDTPRGKLVKPAGTDTPFAELFDLSSQDLRDLDALSPLPTRHPTPGPRQTPKPDKGPNTDRVEPDARGIATRKDMRDDQEPGPLPTSSSRKEHAMSTETRSSATGGAEGPQHGTGISPSSARPNNPGPKDEALRESGTSSATAKRDHEIPKGGTSAARSDGAEAAEEARADARLQRTDIGTKDSAAKPGRASPDLDDDEWWEDLDNTDLATLLECPA